MSVTDNDPLLRPWERLVREKPDAPAIIEMSPRRAWTFREIDCLARERQAALEGQSVRLAGLPVAFQEANGGEWMARLLALLRLGAPAVPLDVSTPEEAVRACVTDCGAGEWMPAGELRVGEKTRRYRRPAIALLKLTSGSTGRPKSLPFQAKELAADGRQVMDGMGIDASQRNFAIIPFGHSYGLGNLVMPLLLEGVPVVCGSSPLPHILAEEFDAGQATVLPAVPSIFKGLVRAGVKLPGLRRAITAGAPLAPELARAFRDCFSQPLHNFFGSSETGGITYDADGEAGLSGRSVGRPLPGVHLSLDRNGRVRVASAAVFTRGNRRRRQGVGEVAVADLGAWNERGELVLKGRTGKVIKVGARRLDLGEIERILATLPGVRDAWVTAWQANGEERPAAVVAGDVPLADLRAALRRKLAAWKMPRPLAVIEKLPTTGRGKPDRAQLCRLLRREEDRR